MRLLLLLLLIAVILAAPALLIGDRFDVMLDGTRALEFIRAQGPWGGVVGIGLIIADLVVPIPSPAIMRLAIGNLIGSIPVGFAYAYFGAHGEDNPGLALAAAAILPYLALPVFLALFARRSKERQVRPNQRMRAAQAEDSAPN